MTGGETGADASSFWSIGSGKASTSGRGSANKDASGGSDAAAGAGAGEGGDQDATNNENSGGDGSGNGWDLNEIGKNNVKKWTNQKQAGPSEEGDYDDVDGVQQRHHRQPGAEGEDDELYMDDEELVESVVIIGLCMVVGYLMYVRQFRFGNQQQPQQQQQDNQNNDGNNNNNNNVNNQQQQQQQPPMGGLPGDPNAPGRFAYYAAGG